MDSGKGRFGKMPFVSRYHEMCPAAHSHFEKNQVVLIDKVKVERLNGEPKAQIFEIVFGDVGDDGHGFPSIRQYHFFFR